MSNEEMRLAWLEEIEGANKGNQIALGEDKQRIGRGVSCEIHLSDARISREHATIRFQEGAFTIKDLDSANGTFVNGIPIQETRLSTGDRIRLGDTELVFNLGEFEPSTLIYPQEQVRTQIAENVIQVSREPVIPTVSTICAYCDFTILSQMSHCPACGAPVDPVVEKSMETPPLIVSPPVPLPADTIDESPITETLDFSPEPKKQRKGASRKLIIGIGALFTCCCIVGITFMCILSFGSSGSGNEISVEPTPSLSLYSDDEYPVTIVSEEYFEGNEAEEFALATMYERDPGMNDTLRYAEARGYISIEEDEILSAARVTIGDGKVYDLFQAGSSPEESVIFIQGGLSIDEFDQAETFFLRLEDDEDDPKLILYHQDGAIEIKESGLAFIAESNTETIAAFSPKVGVMSPDQASGCTTSSFQDYQNCVSSQVDSKYAVACGAAFASLKTAAIAAGVSMFTLSPTVGPALIASIAVCGYPAYICIPYASDQPPVGKIVVDLAAIEGKTESWCNEDLQFASNEPIYSVTVQWEDDRIPFPSSGTRQYSGVFDKIRTITAEDCAGQQTNINNSNLEGWELHPSERCPDGQRCKIGANGVASCFPINEEQPPPIEPPPDSEEQSPPPEPEPDPVVPTWPFKTVYSGPFTSVWEENQDTKVWSCSTYEKHWLDTILTYKLNDDGDIYLVGVNVNKEEQDVNEPVKYKKINDYWFYEKHTSGDSIYETTLRFSAEKLEITTIVKKTDGSSGTCVNTLYPRD